MAINKQLFKLLRQSGLGHTAAIALSDPDSPFKVGSEEPTHTKVAVTADTGDVILADATSRTVTDGVLNSTTLLTSATAAFTSADVGLPVSGTGVPVNTVIASVTSGTNAVMSHAATATATGVSVTIGAPFTVILPAATAGAKVTVKRLNGGGNAVTVAPAAGTIDGASTASLSSQYAKVTVVADGTNWFVVA